MGQQEKLGSSSPSFSSTSSLLAAASIAYSAPPPSLSPGLSTKDLKLLPYSKYSRASMGTSDCPICLETFRNWDFIRIIPGCGHGFHSWCVDKWMKSLRSSK